MERKKYKDFTPEQKEAHKKAVAKYQQTSQKRVVLKYKKEIAEEIYRHAESTGIPPITWIKSAIAEKYLRETGKPLAGTDTKDTDNT